MKNRSPLAVFFLSFITLGIYGIYWFVTPKGAMNARGSEIPTAWLLIIPFVSWWWLWKYSEGVDKATNGGLSSAVSFLLVFFLGGIGMALIQNEFNKVGAAVPSAAAPTAPIPPATPTSTPQPPAATPPIV